MLSIQEYNLSFNSVNLSTCALLLSLQTSEQNDFTHSSLFVQTFLIGPSLIPYYRTMLGILGGFI